MCLATPWHLHHSRKHLNAVRAAVRRFRFDDCLGQGIGNNHPAVLTGLFHFDTSGQQASHDSLGVSLSAPRALKLRFALRRVALQISYPLLVGSTVIGEHTSAIRGFTAMIEGGYEIGRIDEVRRAVIHAE